MAGPTPADIHISDEVAKVEGNRPKDAMNKNTAMRQLSRLVDEGIRAAIRPRSWNKEGRTPYFAVEIPGEREGDNALYNPRAITDYLFQRNPLEVEARLHQTGPHTFTNGSNYRLEFQVDVPGEGLVQNSLRNYFRSGWLGDKVFSFTLDELRSVHGIVSAPKSGRRVKVLMPSNPFNYQEDRQPGN